MCDSNCMYCSTPNDPSACTLCTNNSLFISGRDKGKCVEAYHCLDFEKRNAILREFNQRDINNFPYGANYCGTCPTGTAISTNFSFSDTPTLTENNTANTC